MLIKFSIIRYEDFLKYIFLYYSMKQLIEFSKNNNSSFYRFVRSNI